MAGADVLKELWVKVGYQIDQSGGQRAQEALKNLDSITAGLQSNLLQLKSAVENTANSLAAWSGEPLRKYKNTADDIRKRQDELSGGLSRFDRVQQLVINNFSRMAPYVAALGAATAGFMASTASHFQNVVNQSRILGESSGRLEDLRKALESSGLSFDKWAGYIQALNLQFKTNPGLDALARSIAGVDKASWDAMPPIDRFTKLIQGLRNLPPIQAKGFGEALGIDFASQEEFKIFVDNIEKEMARLAEARKDSAPNDADIKAWAEWSKSLNDTLSSVLDGLRKSLGPLRDATKPILERFKEISEADPFVGLTTSILSLISTIGILKTAWASITGGVTAAAGTLVSPAAAAVVAGALTIIAGSGMLGKGAQEAAKIGPEMAGPRAIAGASADLWKSFTEWLKPKFGFQHGGIVRIGAHEGEMVLPRNISEGLQSLFGWGNTSSKGASEIIVSTLEDVSRIVKDLFDRFEQWWSGSSAFAPHVVPVSGTSTAGGAGGGAGAAGGAAGAGEAPRAGVAGAGRMPGRIAPGAAGKALSLGQLKQLALNAGFKGREADMMAAIAMSESGGIPSKIGDSGRSFGITQIHEPSWGAVAREALNNPQRAMELAYMVRQKQGWTAWTDYKNANYLKYLNQATQANPEAYGGGAQTSSEGRYSVNKGVDIGNVRGILSETIKAASEWLPKGWRVITTSGYRPGDPRQHGRGNAMDIQLVDPQENLIPNRGEDKTGMYGNFARAWYNELYKRDRDLTKLAAWGGEFNIPKTNERDLMHFDLGGHRGLRPIGGWREFFDRPLGSEGSQTSNYDNRMDYSRNNTVTVNQVNNMNLGGATGDTSGDLPRRMAAIYRRVAGDLVRNFQQAVR